MAKRLTKQQKEFILLGAVVGITAIVMLLFFRGAPPLPPEAYKPRIIPTGFDTGILKNPDYATLSSPVRLPVEAGPVGNTHPFGQPASPK